MGKRTRKEESPKRQTFRAAHFVLAVLGAAVLLLGSAFTAVADVVPPSVDQSLAPGAAFGVDKTVQTPEFPPSLDLCLLMDLTGSFAGDLTTIQNLNLDDQIFDNVRSAVPDSRFCIASFRDFPLNPFGIPEIDYPYALDLDFVTSKAAFTGAFGALSANGGNDFSESQYEALYQIATGAGLATGNPALNIAAGQNPGWSLDSAVTRVVAVWTDATFHTPADPGYPSPHGQAEVVSVLTTGAGPFAPIRVVGLKQFGAGSELDDLAAASGGSTVEGVDATAIANAIVQGIGNLPVTVTPVPVGCAPLNLSYTPSMTTVIGGNPALFHEVIGVPDNAEQGSTVNCSVNFVSDTGEVLGTQDITIHILDVTPPQATCVEGPNPAGNTPKAGQKSPGQNEDGFYHLYASDNVEDSVPDVFLMDLGSNFVFGPFSPGTNIKYTQAPGASPSQSPMSGEVDWKLKGQGDFVMWAVDAAGNASARAACLVPPPPK